MTSVMSTRLDASALPSTPVRALASGDLRPGGPMTTALPAFDPLAYKTTTRAQWEETAAAWHRWGPTLEAWLGEATELMLDLAAVTDGSRVLDVAAGAGGQTLAAARRVG